MTSSNISKVAAGYQSQGLPKGNVESVKKTEDTGDMFSCHDRTDESGIEPVDESV